jgi:hypothetical protein
MANLKANLKERRKSLTPLCICLGFICLGFIGANAYADDRLVVHEWGTFTSVQDSRGENQHGYFINSEPVPAFVHSIGAIAPVRGILSEAGAKEANLALLQEASRTRTKPYLVAHHPDVIMRLETPVMYFYPPPSAKLPISVSVEVGMRGGWLTEFYPEAQSNVTAADIEVDHPLHKDFIGTLSWKGLAVGGEGAGPETAAKVWLAPRETQSANVRSDLGENEKYLFYRGVANVESPLRVSRDGDAQIIGGAPASWDFGRADARIQDIWLVDIDGNGDLAFRSAPELANAADSTATVGVAANFIGGDHAPQNRQKLENAMRAALVRQGLFADEASAMMATWENAYFKTPGTRVFFLVPRSWVDRYLPLRLSVPAKIERVMVGRIELRANGKLTTLN